jgi:ribonuclease HI
MAKKKFYAVKKGRKPGIYLTWDETKRQVNGFPGAIYKSFPTRAEAESWNGLTPTNPKKKLAKSESVTDPNALTLYTDGGSRNTGNVKGGHVRKEDLAAWAFLVKNGDRELAGSGGEFGATNNRMEIMALIHGLQAIQEQYGAEQPVLVVSDSKYVLDAINQNWLWGWKKRGWKKSDGTVVANRELWQTVAQLLTSMTHLEFKWTKGHATNAGNVFVDELLNQTMDKMAKGENVDHQPSIKTVTPKATTSNKKAPTNVETEASVQDLMASFKQLGLFGDRED